MRKKTVLQQLTLQESILFFNLANEKQKRAFSTKALLIPDKALNCQNSGVFSSPISIRAFFTALS
jgi:hypothetical protein